MSTGPGSTELPELQAHGIDVIVLGRVGRGVFLGEFFDHRSLTAGLRLIAEAFISLYPPCTLKSKHPSQEVVIITIGVS